MLGGNGDAPLTHLSLAGSAGGIGKIELGEMDPIKTVGHTNARQHSSTHTKVAQQKETLWQAFLWWRQGSEGREGQLLCSDAGGLRALTLTIEDMAMYVLLDAASTRSFVLAELAKQLGYELSRLCIPVGFLTATGSERVADSYVKGLDF